MNPNPISACRSAIRLTGRPAGLDPCSQTCGLPNMVFSCVMQGSLENEQRAPALLEPPAAANAQLDLTKALPITHLFQDESTHQLSSCPPSQYACKPHPAIQARVTAAEAWGFFSGAHQSSCTQGGLILRPSKDGLTRPRNANKNPTHETVRSRQRSRPSSDTPRL